MAFQPMPGKLFLWEMRGRTLARSRNARSSPVLVKCIRTLVLLLLWAGPAFVQEQPPSTTGRVEPTKVRRFREATISPDGKRVAWVEELEGKNGAPTGHSAIWVTDLEANGTAPRRITAGDGKAEYAEHSLAWAPDGERLAFLSDGSKE